jgi:ABC-type glycerol-3-phosphate transport system substrate-binding protein
MFIDTLSARVGRRFVLTLAASAAALYAPLAAQAQDKSVSGPLVLYSSQPERDLKETLAAFNQQYPDVKVETFRSGTTEAEAGRPAAAHAQYRHLGHSSGFL